MYAFQLIPARGRKLIQIMTSAKTFHISTYPRKGTETVATFSGELHVDAFQLIPARGRKPRYNKVLLKTLLFQLIPVRGRKRGDLHCACTGLDFNLSPQGDGNLGNCPNRAVWATFQLIPAKPSQALRASSPEGRAFPAATYLVLSSPFRGSWHGVSRD